MWLVTTILDSAGLVKNLCPDPQEKTASWAAPAASVHNDGTVSYTPMNSSTI